jgi:hypothetical protein
MSSRGRSPGDLVECARCGVGYHPELVGGACPVCASPAPGRTPRRSVAADNAVLLVGTATIANLVLLAILTVLLLR